MKKDEVKVGGFYTAKVSDRLVKVRIDSTHSKGGWNATNTKTGKRIRIKNAQRLRGAADRSSKAAAPKAHDGEPEEPVNTTTETATPNTKTPAGDKKPKRVSALDAAAQVLAQADQPMGAKTLITAMADQELWKSPAGKTPHATLYAAMMREARDKGGASRFRKVDRGLFAFNANGEA